MKNYLNIRQWLRQSIAARLAMVCFGWSLLVAGLVTLWLVLHEKKEALQHAEAELHKISQSYLPVLNDALWTLDPQRLQSQLDALRQFPELARIELTNDSGELTRIELRPLEQLLLERRYPLEIEIEGQRYPLGELHLMIDAASLNEQMWETAQAGLITSFSTLFFSSLLLLLLFQRWVSRQLHQLALYARQLNADNLSASPVWAGADFYADDEIGAIVEAFSGMQQRLGKELKHRALVEAELKSYQSELELMVEQRTAQLAAQTQRLGLQSQQLQEQNDDLNAFAHTVAHDLKHPLTSMIGVATLLTQTGDALSPAQQQNFLQQILQSSQKMNLMINALLQLAALRSDEEPEKTEVQVEHSIQEALQHLQPLLDENHSQVRLCGPFPKVLAQPQWLMEIWLNYLSNAVKYGGKPAQIEVGLDTLTDNSNCWRFWVRDHGSGVPAGQKDKLFVEFSRLHQMRSDSHGLGLSIVRRICQKLGGNCGYESTVGGGSTFWFTLPLSRPMA
ncbi:sensor histidine kinase [Rheinheimera sp. 4Y26]|uniref:sensor histidine kinase n=1 Tax=Rheinheimera sp. 4Y26 TaxID=2977811 RepID=UPI0021B14EB0|nr:ATP-binding protein [Rheinheimera sp. 4Y26]MCT6698631.1 ATP-binding protein [Rheinheimera sp. 4Y26]